MFQVEIGEPDPEQEMPHDRGDQAIKPGHYPKPLLQSGLNVMPGQPSFKEFREDYARIMDPGSTFRNPDSPVNIGRKAVFQVICEPGVTSW